MNLLGHKYMMIGMFLLFSPTVSIAEPISSSDTINSMIMNNYSSESAHELFNTKEITPVDLISQELSVSLNGYIMSGDVLLTRTSNSGLILSFSSLYSFEYNESRFKKNLTPIMHEFVNSLKNKDASLMVIAHSDSVGSDGYNSLLSLARANHVTEWLQEQGMPYQKIKKGNWGELYPRVSNRTKERMNFNRRIDFIFTNN